MMVLLIVIIYLIIGSIVAGFSSALFLEEDLNRENFLDDPVPLIFIFLWPLGIVVVPFGIVYLIGVLFGSISSKITLWVKNEIQNPRENTKKATS